MNLKRPVVGLVLLTTAPPVAAAQIVNTEHARQGPGGSGQGGPPRDPQQPTETGTRTVALKLVTL